MDGGEYANGWQLDRTQGREQAGWLHSPGCENELSAWAVPAETEKLRRKVYCKVESGTIHVKLPGTAAAVYRSVSSSEEMRG